MRARAALLVGWLVVGASVAHATDPVPWDQERATRLALSLQAAATEVVVAARAGGPSALGGRGRAEQFQRLLVTMEEVVAAVARLAGALAAGGGETETRPLFEDVLEGRLAAELVGSPVFIRGEVVVRIGKAVRILEQLRAYYGPSRRDLLPALDPDAV